MMLWQRLALGGDLVVREPMTLMALGSAALTAVGTAVSAAGTIASGNAAEDAGRRAQQAQVFKSQQLEMQAQESRAAAQRDALEKRRQGELAGSQLQARAAASGGGADDPTIVGLGEEIAGRSEYQALASIYTGENRARGMTDEAMGARMTGDAALAEGQAKKTASTYSAVGTIFSGAGSMFDKYKTYK